MIEFRIFHLDEMGVIRYEYTSIEKHGIINATHEYSIDAYINIPGEYDGYAIELGEERSMTKDECVDIIRSIMNELQKTLPNKIEESND